MADDVPQETARPEGRAYEDITAWAPVGPTFRSGVELRSGRETARRTG